MTLAILSLMLLLLAGIPIALALPAPSRTWPGLIGEGWLLGAGAAWGVLFLLSTVGIAWSRLSLGVGLALVAIAALAVAARRGLALPAPSRPAWPNLLDIPTALLVGGHALLATAAPPIESDYLLIWGVKARMFLAAGGIDWGYLDAPLNVTSHPDYPLLLPLLYDAQAIVSGGWPEAWTGLVTFAFGLASLLALRGLLAGETSRLPRAAITLILMPLLFSPYIGIAEGPLVAYATIGVLHVRRGVLRSSSGHVLRGALFLGLAASCKNEGVSMIAAAALGVAAAGGWRHLPRFWPAVAIPLPWIVMHRLHGVTSDFSGGGTLERLAARLRDPAPVFREMLERSAMPWLFWAGIAGALLLSAGVVLRRERLLLVAVLAQLLFFVGAYFTTPYDLAWHVQTSWDRIFRQVIPLIALLGLLPGALVIVSRSEENQCH